MSEPIIALGVAALIFIIGKNIIDELRFRRDRKKTSSLTTVTRR